MFTMALGNTYRVRWAAAIAYAKRIVKARKRWRAAIAERDTFNRVERSKLKRARHDLEKKAKEYGKKIDESEEARLWREADLAKALGPQ